MPDSKTTVLVPCSTCGGKAIAGATGCSEIAGLQWQTCYIRCTGIFYKDFQCHKEVTLEIDADTDRNAWSIMIDTWNRLNTK